MVKCTLINSPVIKSSLVGEPDGIPNGGHLSIVMGFTVSRIWSSGVSASYRRTGFNCENLITSFTRVSKLLIRKLILVIARPYVQFAQMQLFKFTM